MNKSFYCTVKMVLVHVRNIIYFEDSIQNWLRQKTNYNFKLNLDLRERL